MSSSTILRIAVSVGIVIIVASALLRAQANRERQDLMLSLSMSVGAALVHTTNSAALTGVTAELMTDISEIHVTRTSCFVHSGDEAPPFGDGSAYARLVLTNEMGQTLALRLRPEHEQGTGLRKFRVLGYRKTEPRLLQ